MLTYIIGFEALFTMCIISKWKTTERSACIQDFIVFVMNPG